MDGVATLCVKFNSMHGLRASISAGPYGTLIGVSFHKLTPPLQRFLSDFLLRTSPSTSHHLTPRIPSRQNAPTRKRNPHRQPTMPPHPFTTLILLSATTLVLPLLTASTPTATNTNQTAGPHPPALANLPTSILPHALAADTCPTPPTEFLPYAPPPGYTPAPGCPPASGGTQPSENNAGGGSGSGSSGGTSSAETSGAGRLHATDAAGKALVVLLGWCAVVGCSVRWKLCEERTSWGR